MYEHNLSPIALEFMNIKIYWYSLAYIFGFIFCIYYSKFLINNKLLNLKIEIVDDFVTWSILAILVGGRLGYVIFYNFELYFNNPLEILKIWKGGMSFHGGLLGILSLMIIYSKLKKIKFTELANLVVYSAPVGIFLGRIANFINGELIGRPTDGSWGVLYGAEKFPRHPSQIYEAIFEGLIIFLILYFFLKTELKKKFHGFAIFLIFYSFFRFNLEFLREPDQHLGFVFKNFSMGQILSIPMFIFGFIFLRYGKK